MPSPSALLDRVDRALRDKLARGEMTEPQYRALVDRVRRDVSARRPPADGGHSGLGPSDRRV